MPAKPAFTVPAVSILFGRKAADVLFDEYICGRHINRIKSSLGVDQTGAVSRYELGDSDLPDILDEVSTAALWGGARLVIVTGAEALLDPAAAARRDLEPLVGRIKALAGKHAPAGYLVLVARALRFEQRRIRTAFKPAMELIETVEASGGLFSCVPPFESALKRALVEKARAAGRRLPAASVQSLVEIVGTDQLALMEELDKLISATADSAVITPQVVEALAVARPQATVFSLADSIIEGDVKTSLARLHQLRSTPATRALGYLSGGVASTFRRYRDAARLVAEGSTPAQAARSVGVPRFVQDGFIKRLGRLKAEEADMLLERLLQCDVEVKTGSVQEETALVNFVSDSCRRRARHSELAGRWIYEV